jgi:CopG family nickel-responsive transcriptional regulator
MPDMVRFSASLEKELLGKFDKYLNLRNISSRSEGIRDLVRKELVAEEWVENKEVAGAITLIYDHHRRDLVNKLVNIQHDFGHLIVSTQHVHLDHHNCLEIIAVRGHANKAKQLYEHLGSTRGIKHVGFARATTGREVI